MADKLGVWQQALVHLETAPIKTLTDTVVSVNVFNNAWTGVVEEAFNEGDWNFAKSTAEVSEATGEEPSSGYQYVYEYPDGYMRTVDVSNNTYFQGKFLEYIDEGGFLHSNYAPLFVRYISDDVLEDVEDWPTMFWRYVAIKLAYETCGRLTQSTTLEDRLERKKTVALRKAKNVDARQEKVKRLGQGSWLTSRYGGIRQGGSISTLAKGEIILNEGEV